MSGWPGPDSEEVTDWQERQVVSTADTLRVQGQPAARPGRGGAAGGGCALEVPEPQCPHLRQVVMKIIADTLCTTSVTRLLEPRLNAVSGPGFGTGRGRRRTHGGLRTRVPHVWATPPTPLESSASKAAYFTF